MTSSTLLASPQPRTLDVPPLGDSAPEPPPAPPPGFPEPGVPKVGGRKVTVWQGWDRARAVQGRQEGPAA